MSARKHLLKTRVAVVTLLTSVLISLVAASTRQLPMVPTAVSPFASLKGWTWFPGVGMYEYGIDDDLFYHGRKCAYIRSQTANPLYLGATLTQTFGADKYRGKRMKFSGVLKTEASDGSAALTMNIFDREGFCRENLGFDNMWGRNVSRVTDWTKVKVVLDVPEESRYIEIGITMCGKGQAWVSDLMFEETTDETTGRKRYEDEPQNLDFSE